MTKETKKIKNRVGIGMQKREKKCSLSIDKEQYIEQGKLVTVKSKDDDTKTRNYQIHNR